MNERFRVLQPEHDGVGRRRLHRFHRLVLLLAARRHAGGGKMILS